MHEKQTITDLWRSIYSGNENTGKWQKRRDLAKHAPLFLMQISKQNIPSKLPLIHEITSTSVLQVVGRALNTVNASVSRSPGMKGVAAYATGGETLLRQHHWLPQLGYSLCTMQLAWLLCPFLDEVHSISFTLAEKKRIYFSRC